MASNTIVTLYIGRLVDIFHNHGQTPQPNEMKLESNVLGTKTKLTVWKNVFLAPSFPNGGRFFSFFLVTVIPLTIWHTFWIIQIPYETL